MARVAGVDLPPQKRAQIGLTYIYGVGKARATAILDEAQININTKIKDLSEDELTKIRALLDTQGEIEGDLRKRVVRGARSCDLAANTDCPSDLQVVSCQRAAEGRLLDQTAQRSVLGTQGRRCEIGGSQAREIGGP